MPGYGNPPPEHRFKKGQSGNPTGRRSPRVDFQAMLMEDVQITRNGKKQNVPLFEAQVLVLLKRAINEENLTAIRRVFKLLKDYGALDVVEASPEVIRIVKEDNLPSDLRSQLMADKPGRVRSIEEMDEIRQAYFAVAPRIMAIRNEIGCYTSNEEFRAQLISSKTRKVSGG